MKSKRAARDLVVALCMGVAFALGLVTTSWFVGFVGHYLWRALLMGWGAGA